LVARAGLSGALAPGPRLPRLALARLTLPRLTLPRLTLPRLTLPRLILSRLTLAGVQFTEDLHEFLVNPLVHRRMLGHRQVTEFGQPEDRRIDPGLSGRGRRARRRIGLLGHARRSALFGLIGHARRSALFGLIGRTRRSALFGTRSCVVLHRD
jgi:hypothetical protein